MLSTEEVSNRDESSAEASCPGDDRNLPGVGSKRGYVPGRRLWCVVGKLERTGVVSVERVCGTGGVGGAVESGLLSEPRMVDSFGGEGDGL